MCIQKSDLENKIQEIKRYKTMAEEAKNIQQALEAELILYMKENKLSEEFTDSYKITYKPQSRTTLDRSKLLDVLGEDLKPFEVTTYFSVLRIK